MMISGKKKKSGKARRISFTPGALRKRTRPRAKWVGPGLAGMMKVLVVVGIVCGMLIGLRLMEKYVTQTVPARESTVELELVGVPAWVNDQLKKKVYTAAQSSVERLRLDEDTALAVQRNLAQHVVWLDDIRVRTTHDCLRVEARWRRPVALIESGPVKFYIDAQQVVLDYVPVTDLPVVQIKGLSSSAEAPRLGQVWRRDDLAAAIAILNRLDQMDRSLRLKKPLLYEIDRIDVSNFDGRKNDRRPHIVLYTKDGTEITWGAEVGKWQQYLESTDEQKLAKLYSYYKEYGTLSGGAKYINLRDPRDRIPLPIDRY
jgi:Cell division protein FtsQ/DivIB, C-terminal